MNPRATISTLLNYTILQLLRLREPRPARGVDFSALTAAVPARRLGEVRRVVLAAERHPLEQPDLRGVGRVEHLAHPRLNPVGQVDVG